MNRSQLGYPTATMLEVMRWCRDEVVSDMIKERPSFEFYPEDFFGDGVVGKLTPAGQIAHLQMVGSAIQSGTHRGEVSAAFYEIQTLGLGETDARILSLVWSDAGDMRHHRGTLKSCLVALHGRCEQGRRNCKDADKVERFTAAMEGIERGVKSEPGPGKVREVSGSSPDEVRDKSAPIPKVVPPSLPDSQTPRLPASQTPEKEQEGASAPPQAAPSALSLAAKKHLKKAKEVFAMGASRAIAWGQKHLSDWDRQIAADKLNQAQRFDLLWALYPNRKGSKAKSMKAVAASGATFKEVARGILETNDSKARLRASGEFTPEDPHAQTWFCNHRWEDDVDTAPSSPARGDGQERTATEIVRGMSKEEIDRAAAKLIAADFYHPDHPAQVRSRALKLERENLAQ